MKMLSGFKNNRRAQGIIELIVAMVVIFAFVLITLYGNRVLKDFNTEFQADASMNNESKAVVSNLNDRYDNTFDALVPLVYVILLLVVAVAGWLSDTHPVVFFALLVVVVFVMIVGGVMSNTWEDLKADNSLSDIVGGYPMTDFLLSHYMVFVGVLGFFLLGSILLRNRLGD